MKQPRVKKPINWSVVAPWMIAIVAVGWAISHHQITATFPRQKGVPWWSIFPWGPLATIVMGTGAVFAGIHVYTRQKWWERRAED